MEPSRHIVMFVDDDERLIELYAEAVEKIGVECVRFAGVDDALGYLQGGGRPDVIVWDMMMAPGGTLANEQTQGGLFTGRFLYQRMRDLRSDAAFVLLTIQEDGFEEANQPRLRSFSRVKTETSPDELAELIASILGLSPDQSKGA